MSMIHHLRFGTHAETKYFLNGYSGLYDQIVFNGNMVAYTQAAIAAFIISASDKKFLIDPQTHAFQHDPSYVMSKNSKGQLVVKKSILQLAEKIGSPIHEAIGGSEPRAVVPGDFQDDSAIESLAKGTLGFQKGIITEIESHSDWEYLSYKLEQTNEPKPRPNGLIAPYFYMTEASIDKWLPINEKLIAASVAFKDDYELMAEIVISKDVLVDGELLTRVIEAYSKSQATTVLLWVDSLNEVEASKLELRSLRRLAEEITLADKKVINLYGGYFSALLANKGFLEGVCNGLEYGESRGVVPVGGGIPMSKYYFTPLHFRMRFADLLTIYNRLGWGQRSEDFGQEVCGCELCELGEIQKFGETNPVRVRRKNSVITLNYPTPEAKDYSLRHYLHAKNEEFEAIKSKNFSKLEDELVAARDMYGAVIGVEPVSHIDKWISALKDEG